MKRYRTALIAGVVCLGLFAYVMTFERGRAPQKGEAFGLDAKEATALLVKDEVRQLGLQKQGDQWLLTEPVKGWADKEAVERMVKAVAELKPTGKRDAKEASLSDPKFGLDKPKLTATLTYGAGKTVTVMLGAQIASGSEYYAKIDNRPELYLVPASLQNDLTQQVDNLRDKALAHFDKEKIVSYTLQYPDTVLALEKRGSETEPQWQLTQPYAAKADEWNAKQVAEKLAGLKAEAFAPDQAPAAGFGFDKPAVKATVKTADGKQYVITIGGHVPVDAPTASTGSTPAGADKVYAQLEGRPEVLIIPQLQVSDLKKTDMDMRDKRLVSLKKEQVDELKVERKQGVSFTVRRLPDGWQLLTPATGKAKATKVDDMLWDLSELEAKAFLGEQKDLKQYGLELPDTIISAKVRGQGEPVKIYIGYKKADGIYYAKVASSNQVYEISEMLVLDLPKTLEELKEPPAASSATSAPTPSPSTPSPPAS